MQLTWAVLTTKWTDLATCFAASTSCSWQAGLCMVGATTYNTGFEHRGWAQGVSTGGEHRGGEHRGGEHRGGEHRGGEHNFVHKNKLLLWITCRYMSVSMLPYHPDPDLGVWWPWPWCAVTLTLVQATSCEVARAAWVADPITLFWSPWLSHLAATPFALRTSVAVAFATAFARASSVSWWVDPTLLVHTHSTRGLLTLLVRTHSTRVLLTLLVCTHSTRGLLVSRANTTGTHTLVYLNCLSILI